MGRARETAERYFEAWNAHDTKQLAALFSASVNLTDWEISATGLSDVLAANQKIFDDVPNIRAEILRIVTEPDGSAAVAVIKVVLPDNAIDVVDVLELDGQGKIQSIKAYRGF